MVKLHLAPDVFRPGALAGLVGELLLLQEIEDVVSRGGGGLHLGHALGQGAQGGGEQPDVEDEGHDDAKGDLALHGQGGAQHTDHHIAQVTHHRHQGLHDA